MTEEKKAGKFQTFLFLIVIPFIFLIILACVGLWLSGVGVKDVASHIPFVKDFVQDDKQEAASADKTKDGQTEELQKTIKEQKTKIDTLTSDLKTSDEEIKRLNQKVRSFEKLEKDAKKDGKNKASSDTDSDEQVQKVVKIYQSMDSGKAAKILSQLNEKEAVKILNALNKQKISEILAKMSPDKAAGLTEQLSKLKDR
ncbi:MotE family protein [Bacillus sonorensis]|uniref:MotE family protein n=1 Tax=Bacillus sonorensis TaxID=119858 RepID=UPI002280D85B|nr:MotE family protein [Bacillus sonorensis]MCY8032103.1 MotE family protein [Bacillus sonorensis]MCY8565726.1 MotE family protein [Bacillus sonorensis]